MSDKITKTDLELIVDITPDPIQSDLTTKNIDASESTGEVVSSLNTGTLSVDNSSYADKTVNIEEVNLNIDVSQYEDINVISRHNLLIDPRIYLNEVYLNSIEDTIISESLDKIFQTEFAEVTGVSEQNTKVYDASKSETLANNDAIIVNILAFYSDLLSLAESFSALNSINRSILETLTLVENLVIADAISYADSLGVSDLLVNSFSNLTTEGLTLAESIQKLYATAINENALVTSDSSINTISPVYSELISNVEVYNINFSKSISDTLTLLESMNVNDNQTLSELLISLSETVTLLNTFSRTTAETITLSESIVNSFNTAFTETLALSEVVNPVLSLGIILSDIIANTDSIVLLASPQIADLRNVTDALSFLVSSIYTDIVSNVDSSVYSTTLNKTEALTIAETIITAATSFFNLTDAGTIADSIALNPSPSLIESITNSESLVKAIMPSILDTIAQTELLVNNLSRASLETISNADTLINSVSRPNTDTSTTADSGNLYYHNYSDGTYFAQDYVGTNTTF